MLVLKVVVLVLVTEAALPLSTVLFLLLLEDVDEDSWQHGLNLASLATNHLLDGDTIVDLLEQLDVLIHVDVCTPAVSDAEEHLLEHRQVHAGLASCVVNPLLRNLTRHLILAVEWKQDLVHPL